jgi:hypothetical protein
MKKQMRWEHVYSLASRRRLISEAIEDELKTENEGG